jgi:transcriptional regulator with XRE-family HTH domain
MRQKSLRQLAKELGVSHSYLSQISHGKRPASAKVVSKIRKIGKQSGLQNAKILSQFTFGEVSELADEHDLGSCAARRRGSSPLFPMIG